MNDGFGIAVEFTGRQHAIAEISLEERDADHEGRREVLGDFLGEAEGLRHLETPVGSGKLEPRSVGSGVVANRVSRRCGVTRSG